MTLRAPSLEKHPCHADFPHISSIALFLFFSLFLSNCTCYILICAWEQILLLLPRSRTLSSPVIQKWLGSPHNFFLRRLSLTMAALKKSCTFFNRGSISFAAKRSKAAFTLQIEDFPGVCVFLKSLPKCWHTFIKLRFYRIKENGQASFMAHVCEVLVFSEKIFFLKKGIHPSLCPK